MSLRLATQKLTSRTPLILTRAASSGATADKGADPKNTPPPEKPNPQAGHDQWMASLASASEEAVKADRSAAWDEPSSGGAQGKNKYKGMQEKSKKVAEEMKDSTASLTDGLWRSVGGGR